MALHRVLKIIAIVLGIIGAIYLGMVVGKGDDAIMASGESIVGGFLYTAYITMFITLFLVLIFVVKGLFEGNLKRTFIPIAAFLLVVLISYVLADGTPMQLREGDGLSGSGAKWVDTGLFVFYILAAVAILAMVFSSVKNVGRR